ncbi:integrin beta-PS-like [Spodoptera litura]|uniref:Integrin beta n=1 Tax=Spodoptera litura TaxID=69820 RepID=A0A9J7E0L0_SPOLT|nr:integrin beta-PS-like [Spodoptera litura]
MNILMRFRNNIFLILLISFINTARSCKFDTCGECISYAEDHCVWCAQDGITGSRCRSFKSVSENTTKQVDPNWCKPKYIHNPLFHKETTEDKDFAESKNGTQVQIKPQVIKVKVRPGEPVDFTINFKPAKDYPLDVYYLMDISYTMQTKVDDLKRQAQKIYKDLSAYTNNVRLGIGSFVEKPGFPYVDPIVHKSHAFKNHIPLTDDMKLFISTIEHIEFGSNFDDREAGLDGLMQAMKCRDEIKWRDNARRIIILSTDAPYHSAGDGKIVGAIKPHDMLCHLKDNMYTEALTLDYPSVSQINKVATDENFKIIFAIAVNSQTNVIPETEYKNLAKQITGATFARLEGGDSVIQIIKEAYEEMANTVHIKYKAPPFVNVTIDQDCNSLPKRHCEVGHKQSLSINGTLVVKSCPKANKNTKYTVTLNPYGLRDNLAIELDIACKCSCEQETGSIVPGICHGSGFIQCGICKCQPGSYGNDCRCNGTSTDQRDMEKCKMSSAAKLCSGRGICKCGQCECQDGFSGDFCEFDDNSCPKPNNQLCFGHGRCIRGQCKCDVGYSEKDCSCKNDDKDCYAPYATEACSGRGKCICGACVCDKIKDKNETYSGVFCDSCEECAAARCKELENYTYCNYIHRDNKAICDRDQGSKISNIIVEFMNKTEINGPKLYMATWCKKELESKNGSFILFKYRYVNHDLKITIQDELESPPKANIWIAAGSAIGLVLLIGILTVIIWKILVDLHDKKEFKKFQDEALAAGYDVSQNPLYQDPSINFSNPVYNNQCTT